MKSKKTEIKPLCCGAVITEPGSSLKNKTGGWRSLKPIVNTKKCSGCGICAGFCPDSAIKIIKNKMRIDYNYCKGCGICAAECPMKLIYMAKEAK